MYKFIFTSIIFITLAVSLPAAFSEENKNTEQVDQQKPDLIYYLNSSNYDHVDTLMSNPFDENDKTIYHRQNIVRNSGMQFSELELYRLEADKGELWEVQWYSIARVGRGQFRDLNRQRTMPGSYFIRLNENYVVKEIMYREEGKKDIYFSTKTLSHDNPLRLIFRFPDVKPEMPDGVRAYGFWGSQAPIQNYIRLARSGSEERDKLEYWAEQFFAPDFGFTVYGQYRSTSLPIGFRYDPGDIAKSTRHIEVYLDGETALAWYKKHTPAAQPEKVE